MPINVALDKGMFVNEVPCWFETTHEHSLAQWIALYFERALWISFEAHCRQQVVASVSGPGRSTNYDLSQSNCHFLSAKDQEKQPVFVSTEQKLVSFKTEILPYWSELCKEDTKGLMALFDEFKKMATEQVLREPPVESINALNGGIQSTTKMAEAIEKRQQLAKRLEDNLRIIKIKFQDLAKEEMESKLEFVERLGYTTLTMWWDELLFKLEKLLADMLIQKHKQTALDKMGLSTQNKKTAKKKLKKKLKKL